MENIVIYIVIGCVLFLTHVIAYAWGHEVGYKLGTRHEKSKRRAYGDLPPEHVGHVAQSAPGKKNRK